MFLLQRIECKHWITKFYWNSNDLNTILVFDNLVATSHFVVIQMINKNFLFMPELFVN